MASVKIIRGDVKAEVEERYIGQFLIDGWVRDEDGNHELTVSNSDSKDEIEALIKEHYGVDIDKRGSLETVKEKALAIIRESKPE